MQLAPAFRSPDGYRINPPSDWTVRPAQPGNGISVIFAAPVLDPAAKMPFVDTLNVVVVPTDEALDVLLAQTKAKYPTVLAAYAVVTDQPIVMPDGQPAHLLGGTFELDGYGAQQNSQLLVVREGKSYTATFTAAKASFDGLRDLFERSLRSFELE